jgi:hypothetical protein
MLTFWEVKSSLWSQRRLTDEWVAVRQKRQQAADNGRLSALKRKGRHAAERDASDNASDQRNANGKATTTATATANIPLDKSNGEMLPLVDPVKAMFDAGVRLLLQSGTPEQRARVLLGKWKRDHGEIAVMAALGKAQREGAIDPVSFVEGCFRAKEREYVPPRIPLC